MELTVKLQVFEGPLDLLLYLLEKNKVNIYDPAASTTCCIAADVSKPMPSPGIKVTVCCAIATPSVLRRSAYGLKETGCTATRHSPRFQAYCP